MVKPDGTWTLVRPAPCRAPRPRISLPPSPRCAVPCSPCAASAAIVSPSALAEFPAANPRAVTAEIAGAHHHVMLDNPEALAEVIGTFLSRS
jgi:pimeloyl-ACP methyl ester carboxylesterase